MSIEIHGFAKPGFEPVREAFEKNFALGLEQGASVAVTRDGEFVVDLWAGEADDTGRAWERDTIVNVYSTTKTMSFLCALILADRGQIDLYAPVSDYWPEFGCNGKERITVRQLLSHQAGLHKLAHLVDKITEILDWELIVSRLEKTEPDFHPGTANAYQAVTFGWLVGELIHRVSGLTVPEFVERRIATPLKLDGLYIGDADTQMHRIPALEHRWGKGLGHARKCRVPQTNRVEPFHHSQWNGHRRLTAVLTGAVVAPVGLVTGDVDQSEFESSRVTRLAAIKIDPVDRNPALVRDDPGRIGGGRQETGHTTQEQHCQSQPAPGRRLHRHPAIRQVQVMFRAF